MTRSVYHFIDSTAFGGAEQTTLTLMSGLDRTRWQPVLVHHPAPGIAEFVGRAREQGIETWPVPEMPEGGEGLRRLPGFVRALRARRPDVFHANLTWPRGAKFALLGAVLARVPAVVATLHLYVDVPVTASVYWQQRLLAAKVGRYIAVSEATKKAWCGAYGIPPAKVSVVPNVAPPAAFAARGPADAHLALREGEGRPLVLTTARLDKQKGLGYLVEAAAMIPEARFVIAGDGPERTSLEAQAKLLGLKGRLSFLGHRADVPDLVAACDLFVLPSLFEGLPLSVLEAMAAGKAVVATAIPGVDEAVVPGETGLLVPPADAAALAGAIKSLLAAPERARAMGAAGQARARQYFSPTRMVASVSRIYEELLDARNRTIGRD